MFTGIIETVGKVQKIVREDGNIHFQLASQISADLRIDQSVAHNGVCLTVTRQDEQTHWVTAIGETLRRSGLAEWAVGTAVNLERSMQIGARIDGHLVQGHIDQTATCESVRPDQGSWIYRFTYDADFGNITIEKGSICINGVSLTVIDSKKGAFSVAIIPYTYENTNFRLLKPGQTVNLEFDVIGKYVQNILRPQ